MRSTNDGTFQGSPTGETQSGGLLLPDELALPAICGQTGKPFLMVVRRQVHGVLELIRAVAIEPAPSVTGEPVSVRPATPTLTSWKFCIGCGHKLEPTWSFCTGCGKKLLPQSHATAAGSSGAGGGMSEDRDSSFQSVTLSGRIEIGSLYHGCPHCHARGYFRCGKCRLFSCWNSYNDKPHLDHKDVWCAACRLWRCTSKKAGNDDSLSELTAYAAHEKTVKLTRGIASGSARRAQIDRPTSIRGYLK